MRSVGAQSFDSDGRVTFRGFDYKRALVQEDF